jgi:excisionase family DNA binding protein
MSQRIVKLKPGETLIIQSDTEVVKDLLTITEVAKSLKCSRNKVYRLIEKGTLKVDNSGKTPKITNESLINFKN